MRAWTILTRPMIAAVAAAGLLLATNHNAARARADMADHLQPLPFADAPEVTGLRLIAAGDAGHPHPRLLIATQQDQGGMNIVAVAPAGPPQPPEPLAIVERNAAWDATPAAGGIAILSSQAGSAISALVWQIAGQPGHQRVNRRNGFGVFGAPHYIKGEPEHPVPVTSVALGGGESRLVLFPPEPDGGYGALRMLEVPLNGDLVDARVLRWGAGYLLVMKLALPGPGRPERAGPDAETILAGRLDCVRLNAAMLPEGRTWQPFPGQPVFQFDAGTVGDGIAILATIGSGAVLSAAGNAGMRPEVTEFRSATPLSSPAVLAVGQTLHLAVLDAAGEPDARVLLTEVPAPAP
ncbi:MAG TPA: hypothetical protein VGG99_10090 [Acetobacteraceae bacterium]|jgi:hypothetical protein